MADATADSGYCGSTCYPMCLYGYILGITIDKFC